MTTVITAPSFPTALVGKVFLVRALPDITIADLSVVLRAVRAASRQVGSELVYWPVIEARSEMPGADVREAMKRATTTLLSLCSSMTVIVQGTGVKASLMRVGIRGMSLVDGHRGKVHVVDSIRAAVTAANDPAINPQDIQKAARELGIEPVQNSALA